MGFFRRNPEVEQLYNLVCLSSVSMMQDSATFLPTSPENWRSVLLTLKPSAKSYRLCTAKIYDIINYLDACGYNPEFWQCICMLCRGEKKCHILTLKERCMGSVQ